MIVRFSEQLPEALELMANSLRSGNTIQSSMQLISEEFMPPISREFGIVSESIRLGIPVEQIETRLNLPGSGSRATPT